jgi:hypothetical protein
MSCLLQGVYVDFTGGRGYIKGEERKVKGGYYEFSRLPAEKAEEKREFPEDDPGDDA